MRSEKPKRRRFVAVLADDDTVAVLKRVAKRRSRASKKFVSLSLVMREALDEYARREEKRVS